MSFFDIKKGNEEFFQDRKWGQKLSYGEWKEGLKVFLDAGREKRGLRLFLQFQNTLYILVRPLLRFLCGFCKKLTGSMVY